MFDMQKWAQILDALSFERVKRQESPRYCVVLYCVALYCLVFCHVVVSGAAMCCVSLHSAACVALRYLIVRMLAFTACVVVDGLTLLHDAMRRNAM